MLKPKNGRTIMKCICSECGITKRNKKKHCEGIKDNLGFALKAADYIVRKVILSTNHVFDQFWRGDIVKGAFNTKKGLYGETFWSPDTSKDTLPCNKITYNKKTKNWENNNC